MTPQLPMTQIVDTAPDPARPKGQHPELHLLRDCLALSGQQRPPARMRLVEAVGEEFARKLLSSVTLTSRAS